MAADQLIGEFEDYLSAGLRLSRQTVSTYVRDCRAFVEWTIHHDLSPLTAGTGDVIDFLIARQTEEGIDQRTVAKIVSALRSLFQYLVLHGRRVDNPAMLVELPRTPHRIPGVLSVQDVERLLGAVDVTTPLGLRDRALFELIYSCGLRISEAVDLTLDRVFLKERLIRVHGKGDKERLVPMGDHARFWIRKYLDEGRPHLARQPGSALFLNHRGERLSRKGMWKRFREIAALAGVEAKVHTLRHSFATHLLEGGADLRAVQELFFFNDTATTEIYTHIDRDDLRKYHEEYHPKG